MNELVVSYPFIVHYRSDCGDSWDVRTSSSSAAAVSTVQWRPCPRKYIGMRVRSSSVWVHEACWNMKCSPRLVTVSALAARPIASAVGHAHLRTRTHTGARLSAPTESSPHLGRHRAPRASAARRRPDTPRFSVVCICETQQNLWHTVMFSKQRLWRSKL